MATNKSTIGALKRMSVLIDRIDKDMVELKLWNKMFKYHIGSQKRQKGSYAEDTYKIDLKRGKVKRFRKGKLIREY